MGLLVFIPNSETCEFEEQLVCSSRSRSHGWYCLSPKLEAKRYKLNVVGSWESGSRCIGGGGVIRNEKGEWLGGFAENLGTGKVIEAKLWALYRGLELAWKSGWAPLEVESDSNVAVTLVLNQVVYKNHPLFQLVKSCQDLLNQNWRCSLRHVFQEQYGLAFCLADLGLSMELGCHYLDVPSTPCGPILDEGECSLARPRSVAAHKMKNRDADRMDQRDARLKNLKVRKLIQKARRMKNRITEEDHPSVVFTWRIETFSELKFKLYSEPFIVGDFKWYFYVPSSIHILQIFFCFVICCGFKLVGIVRRILMYPKGNRNDQLSVYLDVPDATALPLGWFRFAKFSLTLVNQLQSSNSITKGTFLTFPVKRICCLEVLWKCLFIKRN